MNTKIIVGLVAIVIIGGAYYFYTHPMEKRADMQAPAGKIVPKWSFESVPQASESDAPRTKVSLAVGDKSHDAGTYQGSCAEIGSSGGVDGKGLVSGEVSGVQCWFAGGGDEIGLFQENGKLVIKHGELGEPQGEGTEGFRGNFTSFLELGQ